MRFKIFLFLAFFATSAVSAQLYDNRNRYLQSPHSYNRFAQELDGPPKKPAKRYTPRTTSSRNSYNYYRNRVNRYSRAYLTTDDFYRRFRDPNVHRRFSSFIGQENRLTINLNRNPEKSLNFQCFCFLPVDIFSFFNWHDSNAKKLEQKRQDYINHQEEVYLKEMNKRNHKFNDKDFKSAQLRFFKSYVRKYGYWHENGRKKTYGEHRQRLLRELKENADKFDRVFEDRIAISNVVSKLKHYRRTDGSKIKKHFGDLKFRGGFVRDIPKSYYPYYDFTSSMLMSGNKWGLSLFDQRDVYDHFKNNPNDNMNDYLVDQYIKQYNNENDLRKRFSLQSAYLVDGVKGSYRTPSNLTPPDGFARFIPYDKNKILDFYKKRPDFTSPNSIMSFEEAKALVAIHYDIPKNVSDYIQRNSYLKSGVVNYLKNATPIYEELNTVNELVSSRMDNKPFKWSNQLRYLRSWSYQQSRTPETIMKINLKASLPNWLRIREYGIKYSLRIDYDIMTYDFHMHDGIGDMLKKIYRNSSSWSVEGATIRHFLESKAGIKIPSSLSNRDLGKLFDFGGGNSNTLTIKFSDYAKKYITNFHHGDGKYGTSLFTNLLKLKKLYDILKGKPVDFSNNKKPCIGDPVPNPEIAPQKNSGIQGGMHDTCARWNEKTICKGIKGRKWHDGVDIKNPPGAPIYAIYDGVASKHTQYKDGKIVGAGYYSVIKSKVNGKNIRVVYFHLQKDNRTTGVVKAGDIIGYQGDSGNLKNAIGQGHTVSHVHIKTQVNGANDDPLNHIKTKIDPKTGKVINRCN